MMNKKKVLIIDDEQFIRELVSDFLKLEDIDCDQAASPKQALDFIKINSYDIILLDRNLSNIKAEDFIKKNKHKIPSTPIILLTGDHQITLKNFASETISGIIYKPFQVNEFLHKLKEFWN